MTIFLSAMYILVYLSCLQADFAEIFICFSTIEKSSLDYFLPTSVFKDVMNIFLKELGPFFYLQCKFLYIFHVYGPILLKFLPVFLKSDPQICLFSCYEHFFKKFDNFLKGVKTIFLSAMYIFVYLPCLLADFAEKCSLDMHIFFLRAFLKML